MTILVVMAHPRRDSLTGQIADAVISGLESAGHKAELADLYSEGFDPLIMPPDEPDFFPALMAGRRGSRSAERRLGQEGRPPGTP